MKLLGATSILGLLSVAAAEENLFAGIRGSLKKLEQSTIATYNFQDGVTHTLSGNEVDGEFCDPNSKSMSGYMDISGSNYDKSGEDKHLFYWFFEKRTKSLRPEIELSESDEKTPLIVWLTGVRRLLCFISHSILLRIFNSINTNFQFFCLFGMMKHQRDLDVRPVLLSLRKTALVP